MTSRLAILALVFSPHSRAGVDEDLAKAATSPYEIARFVDNHAAFDWAPLWKALSINEDLVSLQPCGQGLPCAQELITVADPFQVIVLLRGGVAYGEEVYLRFGKTTGPEGAGPWIFAGFYSRLVRQTAPRHELIRFGSKPFLLITSAQHVGSDVSATGQTWLDLTRPAFEPVFGLTVDSSYSGAPNGVAEHASALVVGLESQPIERITVTYNLEFRVPFSTDAGLGTRAATVVYARRGGKFVYERTHPPTSERATDKLFDIWLNGRPSNDDYLHDLFPELIRIASGANQDQKGWLRRFLRECKNTKEKRSIEALLPKASSGSK